MSQLTSTSPLNLLQDKGTNFLTPGKVSTTSFGPLQQLHSSVIEEIDNELADLEESDNGKGFPVTAFPPKLQSVINDASKAYSFPKDFTCASVLAAAAASIGATYKVKVKGSWIESGVLFLAIVGRPGVNKSAPITYAHRPIEKQDADDYNQYKLELATAKERQSANNVESANNAPRPKRKQKIIKDTTMEGLIYCHAHNTRGLALVMDELVGLFKNLNKYHKGSDQEQLLQVWSGIPVSVNRKSEDSSILIPNPCISIFGGIQPGVLKEINKDGRQDNGFIDRILFCYPDIVDQPVFNYNEPDTASEALYATIINKLLALELIEDSPTVLSLTDAAKTISQEWINQQRQISQSNNNDKLTSISAKLETYLFRFSLIYQLLNWACGDAEKYEVEESAMISAIQTVEYFKVMALKVNPIDQIIKIPMSQQQLNIYKDLPSSFKTGEGVEIASRYHLEERRFKDWLHDEKLFQKVKHGCYTKVA